MARQKSVDGEMRVAGEFEEDFPFPRDAPDWVERQGNEKGVAEYPPVIPEER